MDADILSNDALTLWRKTLQTLADDHNISLRERSYVNEIVPEAFFGNTLIVSVTNEYVRSMLETRLREPINAALADSAGTAVSLVVKIDPNIDLNMEPQEFHDGEDIEMVASVESIDEAAAPRPEPAPSDAPTAKPIPAPDEFIQTESPSLELSEEAQAVEQAEHKIDAVTRRDAITHLNTGATFDNFVPGESNRFARAAAFAVSEAPGTTYNPLFIYGGSGLGKTHLLNAIGNYTLQMFPALKVRYVNSEEFTNEFIEAVRSGAHSDGQISAFNRKYREIDLLLIDDIQFLSGKEGTIEAFFHTFNALYNANKQIVIASDVSPKLLRDFEQRLVSRFEMGLTVDVQPPSQETRIAILRMKAAMSHITIPADVLELIARQVTDNIRELEGALTRVAAVASLNKQPITASLAEQTLQDYFVSNIQVTPTEIISATATYFQLTFDDLVSARRSKDVALARQIAMYIARELTGLSLTSIGEIFGGRDHTTVIHAYQKISQEMAEKREVFNYVNELTSKLKQHIEQ